MGGKKRKSEVKDRRLDVLLSNLETEKEKKSVQEVESATQELLLKKNSPKLRLKK